MAQEAVASEEVAPGVAVSTVARWEVAVQGGAVLVAKIMEKGVPVASTVALEVVPPVPAAAELAAAAAVAPGVG